MSRLSGSLHIFRAPSFRLYAQGDKDPLTMRSKFDCEGRSGDFKQSQTNGLS
jgi:hypothetical protein